MLIFVLNFIYTLVSGILESYSQQMNINSVIWLKAFAQRPRILSNAILLQKDVFLFYYFDWFSCPHTYTKIKCSGKKCDHSVNAKKPIHAKSKHLLTRALFHMHHRHGKIFSETFLINKVQENETTIENTRKNFLQMAMLANARFCNTIFCCCCCYQTRPFLVMNYFESSNNSKTLNYYPEEFFSIKLYGRLLFEMLIDFSATTFVRSIIYYYVIITIIKCWKEKNTSKSTVHFVEYSHHKSTMERDVQTEARVLSNLLIVSSYFSPFHSSILLIHFSRLCNSMIIFMSYRIWIYVRKYSTNSMKNYSITWWMRVKVRKFLSLVLQ